MSDESAESAERAAHQRAGLPAWLVLPGMLALVLVGLLAGRWIWPPEEIREGPGDPASRSASDRQPSPRPQGATVSVAIDFGNGAERRFAALPWREGMTVLEAMQAAGDFHPGVTIAYRGDGDTAFMTAIDGVANAGAGGGNWIYEINGEKPTESMGLATLEPGDALLWRYSGAP